MTNDVPMPMFVTVLTQGKIDQNMIDAIESQGYELKSSSDFDDYVTNQFKRKEFIHVVS